jgi:imidazolonepropionase-like amidohydrolase
VPTLYTAVAIEQEGVANHIPEPERERNRAMQETEYGGFKRALAAALPIGFATDAMVIEHGDNAKECEVRHTGVTEARRGFRRSSDCSDQ